jgi:hypothetical protein
MSDPVEASGGVPDPTADSDKELRSWRLAEALRANLRRRRQQKRERQAKPAPSKRDDETGRVPSETHLKDFEA